jgi:hypothetical protein
MPQRRQSQIEPGATAGSSGIIRWYTNDCNMQLARFIRRSELSVAVATFNIGSAGIAAATGVDRVEPGGFELPAVTGATLR